MNMPLPRLTFACLVAMMFSACGRAPYSSPTALRDTNAYFKAISPVAPRALDRQALDRVTVTQEGNTLTATYPSSSGTENDSDGFEHTVQRLKPSEKLEGIGSRFEMVALAASGPGISKPPTNGEKYFPLDYFSPEGKTLLPAELKVIGFRKGELTEYASIGGGHEHAFPKLRVVLGSTRQLPGYYTVVGLFDAQTKKSLVSGYGYSQIYSNSLGRVEVHPSAWHAIPMELVLDVELDGKSVVETNAVPGMTVAVPGGEVRLLGIWEGNSGSWSSSSGSAGTPAFTQIDLRKRDDETNAVALFATEPPKLAVHVEVLDGQGKTIEGSGGGTGGGIRMVGIRGFASEVKLMRLTVFTNHHRVVMTLPPIPNLPATSQRVENLFDVAIPQIQIRREYELRDVIGNLTQFKFAYPPGGDAMPTNLFPLMLTNVTPSLLVAEYDRHLTNGCTLVVDEKKQEIRIEPTRAEKIRRWLKRHLRL